MYQIDESGLVALLLLLVVLLGVAHPASVIAQIVVSMDIL
jgi:hypothetical protein